MKKHGLCSACPSYNVYLIKSVENAKKQTDGASGMMIKTTEKDR